jgi:hypothetical protein
MGTERVMAVEEAMAMVAIKDGKTHAWLLLSAREPKGWLVFLKS